MFRKTMSVRLAIGLLCSILACFGISFPPAFAMNSVSEKECRSRNDFLRFTTSTGQVFCYANAGTLDVNLSNVVQVETGANYVEYVIPGVGIVPLRGIWFCERRTISWSEPRRISQASIASNPAVASQTCVPK
jgi:hypothetical protein